ncbi:ACD_00360 [African swine fever virus]
MGIYHVSHKHEYWPILFWNQFITYICYYNNNI